MRIGIFGGTFDPPHIGHQILAAESVYQLGLDFVLWVLTPNPPHKLNKKISPVGLRLAWVNAAIEGEEKFRLSRADLDRPGPHYAIDTVRTIAEEFPEADLYYLIGGDSLRDLHLWYHPDELIGLCTAFGVMLRPGANINTLEVERLFSKCREKLKIVEAPLLEISSSDIQERICSNRPYQFFLPEKVFRLMKLQK